MMFSKFASKVSLGRARLTTRLPVSRSFSSQPVNFDDDTTSTGYADEATMRYDLAVAHRLTADHSADMLVWNHISARFQDGCLITPGNKLWKHMRPEDMVFSSHNVTADLIHSAIYAADKDVGAILHWHTPAATAVSCLPQGFVPMTQDAAYFYQRVARYPWDGISDDPAEIPKLMAAVQAAKQQQQPDGSTNNNTLLLEHHGFVCYGKSVPEVFVLAYYFERACEIQLRLMAACGGTLPPPPPVHVMEEAAKTSFKEEFSPGFAEWEALCEDFKF
ncbi:Putative aldolase class 2 protein [Seminavis robusta]|uniref:Aldolase class 2 protein n=1 Tax=Seminavis robusta TaxID=568900 RepID=A0A9N8HN15_9STRA|nr:Putative aldolase class 2 protein [Seminavis robusta]|eukprot:Sro948_g223530.1 Putative aldolase class 2 protein (276) ;mRNA; f:16441-17268